MWKLRGSGVQLHSDFCGFMPSRSKNVVPRPTNLDLWTKIHGCSPAKKFGEFRDSWIVLFVSWVSVIIRPHRLHSVHRCGLLLPMSHVAWSVRLCVGHMGELCKNGWSNWDAVWGGGTLVDPRNHVLNGVQISSRDGTFLRVSGDNTAMRPFAKLLWTHDTVVLVAWHSCRTSVFGRRTFSVLRSTCSWWVTTYVGKPSATGQPTRPTQPFILSRSINE